MGTAGVLLLALAVIAVVSRFAVSSIGVYVSLNTAISLVGLLAGYLLYRRYRASADLRDLLLTTGFLLLVVTNFCFVAIPAIAGVRGGTFTAWASALGRFAAVVSLMAAALLPRVRAAAPRLSARRVFTAALGLLGAVALGAGVFADTAPLDAASDLPGHPPVVSASFGFALLQLFSAACLVLAGALFGRRALRERDELLASIAVAAGLVGVGLVNYAVMPSAYAPGTDMVIVGDLLRFLAYGVLLIGAFREIHAYSRAAAISAQLRERERLARDLHDGLAQDLAFVSGRLRDLANQRSDSSLVAMLSTAADRALTISRDAISSLSVPVDASLPVALRQAADEVATREGGVVSVRTEGEFECNLDVVESLSRLMREAVTNAIRHGQSPLVTVELEPSAEGGLELRVRDEGKGFEESRAGRYGLESMRQRAAELGGEAIITSAPGEGTEVSVYVPRGMVEADRPKGRRGRGSTRDPSAARVPFKV